MSLSWLRSPSRPDLLPMDCLENRVTKAIESHELFFLLSVWMLTRPTAGRDPCACQCGSWQLLLFLTAGDAPFCSEQQRIHPVEVVVWMEMTLPLHLLWYY